MRWNVTSPAGTTYMVTREATEKRDDKGLQRTEKDTGRPLWLVDIEVMDADPTKSSEKYTVTVPGVKPEVKRGEFVVLDGFQIVDWKMNGKSGISLRADEIRNVAIAAPSGKLKAVG